MSASVARDAGGQASWLCLDVVEDDGAWPDEAACVAAITQAAEVLASHPGFADLPPATACVALSSDAAVQRLNADFRGQDKPTNVLSFTAPPGAVADEDQRNLGDIVLALETVTREAHERGIPFADHVRHLTVHGLLHLLGYDHQTEAEALAMEGLEIEILASLDIPNPYGETDGAETS
jgi:probable rRNA maturation factor